MTARLESAPSWRSCHCFREEGKNYQSGLLFPSSRVPIMSGVQVPCRPPPRGKFLWVLLFPPKDSTPSIYDPGSEHISNLLKEHLLRPAGIRGRLQVTIKAASTCMSVRARTKKGTRNLATCDRSAILGVDTGPPCQASARGCGLRVGADRRAATLRIPPLLWPGALRHGPATVRSKPLLGSLAIALSSKIPEAKLSPSSPDRLAEPVASREPSQGRAI